MTRRWQLLGGLAFVGLNGTPAMAQTAVLGTPACRAPAGAERPWLDHNLSAECRADLLVQRLSTVDAKLKAFASDFAEYGVAPVRGADGPSGPTRGGTPINIAGPLSLAASFDPELAREAGQLVGREFRAGGMTRMLGPTLDIARTWQFGRTAEGFGEDPLLTGRIATAYVRAIQGEGVVTVLKHFAVYGQEQGRTGDLPIGLRPSVNVVVSEKAIRELYLPAFRSAVVDGGALGIMCAFPRINGTYACEHRQLFGILKNEWGFRGTISPDFPDAQRSVIAAVNAGMDSGNFGLPRPALPAPPPGAGGGAPMGPPPAFLTAMGLDRIPGGVTLEQAVRDGRIPAARFDDLLRRNLVATFALDGIAATSVDPVAARVLAVRLATDGSVLLRNERGILPFGSDVRSLAVIGAQAGEGPQVQTTGSASIPTAPPPSALSAIRAAAGGRTVSYADGNIGLDPLPVIAPGLLRTVDGRPGVTATYVANPNFDFAGAAIASRVEASPQSVGSAPMPGLPADHQWSVRWSGSLTPIATGLHRFTISGAGSARLSIGGREVARFVRVDFGDVQHAAVALTAGKPVAISIDYTPREAAPMPVIPMMATTLGAHFRLGMAGPDDRIARAVAAAKAADVAVVFVAERQGEGADRTTLNLPIDQDMLIAAVAAVNPRTVVVLSSGGPVAMPWRDKVAGIIETWYAGSGFGPAAAALLFGTATPGGRLPMTFPADARQGPGGTTAGYPGLTNAARQLTDVRHDEGALVGYRWHLSHPAQKPLYPFGYGLTYGSVALSKFRTVKGDDGSWVVHAQATNRGRNRAVEVVQAYLHLPGAAGQSVPKLAGFGKVTLAPGEARTIEVVVPATAFDYWDEAKRGWTRWRGRFALTAGRSAEQVEFRQTMTR